MKTVAIILSVFFLLLCAQGRAETSNGNDFALAYSEAKDPAKKSGQVRDALGRPHLFRYLQIQKMQETSEQGRPGIQITASEPSSLMQVQFTVTLHVSIALLKQAPASKAGDAIAVTGKVASVDPAQNLILLENPIVRHKDRLAPKIGKEMLAEVNPQAVVYSYTEGPRPVIVEARDRDLLEFRAKVLAESGPKGWCEFLEKEIALRKEKRAKEEAH